MGTWAYKTSEEAKAAQPVLPKVSLPNSCATIWEDSIIHVFQCGGPVQGSKTKRFYVCTIASRFENVDMECYYDIHDEHSEPKMPLVQE